MVVVGGGVIGGFVAWYLARAGCQVKIVEQNQFGHACSRGNCGYLVPSHVLPLTQPGAVQKTLWAMIKPNSPFAIRPRFSKDFFRWFWNFTRRCNRQDMLDAAQGRHQLLQLSRQLYDELFEQEQLDCEQQSLGLLIVYDTESHRQEFSRTNDLIGESFGVAAREWTAEQLAASEPALKSGFGGAWHFECDSHLRPDKLLTELLRRLADTGVELIENCKVRSVRSEDARVVSLLTDQGEINADAFVFATGAWTPFLNQSLGCKIPIEPGKGYSITMPRPATMPIRPMIFEQTHVAISPMKSGYRIGSTMEFVGYDSRIHPKRLGLLKTSAAKYLREPYCEPVEETWFGWRPMTWDGKPIIDRSPSYKNTWIAAGHGMLGLSTATGTGYMIRNQILEMVPDAHLPKIESEHFSISRFG